jgi:hypothetical protein
MVLVASTIREWMMLVQYAVRYLAGSGYEDPETLTMP